jgi:AraC-like DNA-binding protein/Tfp pilus assembly protein PilF
MKWYYLTCIVFTSLAAFPQRELPVDTNQVDQLIDLSREDQWKDPYRSLSYAEQALEHARQIDYKQGIATALNLKGFSYWTFGDNELAIQSALESLDISTAKSFTALQPESYYIMARGYMDLRENSKAHESIVKAEALAEEGSDWTQLCSIYNLKGVIFFNDSKYDSALYFYNKAYEIGKNKPVDPINLPRIISNIGECYADENPALAFRYFTEALDLAKETSNKITEASITSIIGHAYLREKNLKNAESNLQTALELARDLGLRRVMRHAYSGLVDIRLMQGRGDEAVIYLQRYYAVRDSLLNTSKIRQIVELEARHELQLREKNIQLLENERKIQTIWKNLLIGLVILVAVASVTVIQWQRYRYRKNRRMLNLEIDYLTQQHKEAVDKYKTLQIPQTGESIASYDERLLKQAIAIVEANISDSQMSVERMAEEMNMSRTSLHRKIKSVTGFPPSELIRSIRLRKAARLIANRVGSAAQISHMVGFEDYSHFSKAFKKHFGVSPSEYVKAAEPVYSSSKN